MGNFDRGLDLLVGLFEFYAGYGKIIIGIGALVQISMSKSDVVPFPQFFPFVFLMHASHFVHLVLLAAIRKNN